MEQKLDHQKKFDYSKESHIEAMKIELSELEDRIVGFRNFILSDELDERIPSALGQALAVEQLNEMEAYARTLRLRIDFFEHRYK